MSSPELIDDFPELIDDFPELIDESGDLRSVHFRGRRLGNTSRTATISTGSSETARHACTFGAPCRLCVADRSIDRVACKCNPVLDRRQESRGLISLASCPFVAEAPEIPRLRAG